MPESLPPTSDAGPPAEERIPVNWHRVRVYLWSILLVLSLYFYGAARLIREQPKRLAEMVLARLPFPSSLGEVKWVDPQTLEFRDVKLGGFFYSDAILVRADVYQLLRHHISQIDVFGPQLYTEALNDTLRKGGTASSGGLDWTITKLVIHRGTVMLQDVTSDMPSIPIRLGVKQPIILNYIKLAKPDESPSMTRERVVNIENVNIVSPFDPLAPILSFPLIKVRFTYAELWHHHLREIDLIRPVIHLGEDLFWFTDQFKKERAAPPSGPVAAPWQVAHLEVRYGQLAINVFGQPKVQLPFFFQTVVDNIQLDQLDKISAKSVVAINRLDQDYPDYKINIVNLSGKLEFSIPPTDVHANNVVPTIHIDEFSWNGIAAKDVWSSVTFDPTGIYGKLGGNCESGYLKANFEVYYTKGFLWNADLFADKIDSQPIAEKLAGKYFSLTGQLDGEIGVQGRATEILDCSGALKLAHPGLLEIHSIDELMTRLPGAAGSMQQQAMKIGLESFKTYPYQTGGLSLNYRPAGGQAELKLDGPKGKRDFSVYLHPYESSKVAKDDESR
jgi:hypothetical protein